MFEATGGPEQSSSRSLTGLVLVAVLPLLLFGSGAAWMVVDQKKLAVANELANTTRALQVAVDNVLVGQLELMKLLTTDASLDQGNLSAFNDRARRAVQTHREWRNVVLIDSKTHAIVSSALPMQPQQALTSWPTEVDTVRQSRTTYIAGVLASGKIVKEPTIHFLSPVLRNGEVPWVVVVSMDPAPFNGIFSAQRLSASWTGAVLDKNLLIGGRSRDPQRFVGSRVTPTLAGHIAASEGGMFTSLNQEGQSVYTVFSRSPLTGWSVAVGIPAAEVNEPIQRIVTQWAAAGGVLIALALLMTARVGRGILRSRKAYETALRDSQTRAQAALGDFDDLVSRLPVGVYRYRMVADGKHRFDFVSGRFCAQVGARQADILRDPDIAFNCFRPLDLPELIRANESARRTLQSFCWEGQVDHADGPRWLRMESTPTQLPNGDILWNGTQQDITDRKRAEESLRQLSAAVEQSPASVVITDLDANIQYVNPRFTQSSGYSPAEAIGQNPRILHSNLTPSGTYEGLWKEITHGRSWQGELINRRKDGEQFWEEAHIAPIKDAQGRTTHYVAVKIEITERIRSAQKLAKLVNEQQAILNNELVGIVTVRDGRILWANPAYAHMLGYEPEELAGMATRQLYASQAQYETVTAETSAALASGENYRSRIGQMRKDGQVIWIDANCATLNPVTGETLWGLIDITQRVQMEEQVRQLAFYDGLTGLANRRLFNDRLNQCIHWCKRSRRYGALLFLDLDNFKPLNDAQGHRAGDLLLIEVATRMKACVRETDTAARFGGDEFVVLLVELTGERATSVTEAAMVAEKIRAAIGRTFVLKLPDDSDHEPRTTEHSCSASIGVAMIGENEATAEDVLRWADKAMYAAKEHGRNQVWFSKAFSDNESSPYLVDPGSCPSNQ